MYLYHGTSSKYLNYILEDGLSVSTSGFGQSGLEGVGLLPDFKEAAGYARSAAYKFDPIVLTVEISDILRLKDLRGIWDIRWHFYEKYGLSPALVLSKEGYHGAVISSTLGRMRSPEYVIFDPKNCQVVGILPVSSRKLGRCGFTSLG